MKFANFIAGFFQDQSAGTANAGSRKAIALFVLLYFLSNIVKAATQGITVDSTVIYCVVGLLAWTLGAITVETVLKYMGKPSNNKPDQSSAA